MKRISLILALSIILSTVCLTPVFAGTEAVQFPYINEFTSQPASDDAITIKPVANKPQESVVISDEEGTLIFRGAGDTSWTSSTSHVRLWLGEIPNKPKIVYEVKIKGKNFAGSANVSFRTNNSENPLFYIDSSNNVYDKNKGTLITTISDFTTWHTFHIIYDNQISDDEKYYRTILIDGKEYENSRAEGNEYAKTGEFNVSPSASLQTHATVGDRMVYYDYIKIYEYPDEFKAEVKADDSLNKVKFKFSFDVKEDTLKKENITFVSEDLTHTVQVDSVKKISGTEYEMTLSEKLNFKTTYNVNISDVESITGQSLLSVEPLSIREARCQINKILLSGNGNVTSGDQTVDIYYINETKNALPCKLVYAQYKADGSFISIDEKSVTLTEEKEDIQRAEVIIDENAASVQLYLKNIDGTDFSGTYTLYKAEDIFFAPLNTPQSTIVHYSNYVIDENSGEVTITVETEEESTVTLNVKKAEDIIYAFRLNTEDKKAEFKLTPETDGETYIYSYTVNKGLIDGSGEIVYYTPGYIQSSFEGFNKTENSGEVAAFLSKLGTQLNIDLDTYNSYSDETTDKETVLKSLIAQRKLIEPDKQYADITSVNNALNIAYKLISLKNGNISIDDIKDMLDTDTYTYYKDNMTKGVKSAISEHFKNKELLTIDELNTFFKDTMIFKAIEKGENYKLTTGIIAKYHTYIGLDLSIYSTLINAYLADSAIHGTQYTSFLLLKDAFDKAVLNQKDAETVLIPSGGSGGGGGGGGPRPVIDFTPPKESEEKPVEILPVPEVKNYFNDLSGYDWAEKAINKLAQKDVVNGKSEGVYAPEDFVTRAELVKMIIGAFDIGLKSGTVDFADLSDSHWGYDFIVTACENNLLKGIDENTFSPDSAVTREMAATILYRVCLFKNIPLNSGDRDFNDKTEISDYAAQAVKILGANSVINGYEDGTFKPKGNVTRAEIAVLINNINE